MDSGQIPLWVSRCSHWLHFLSFTVRRMKLFYRKEPHYLTSNEERHPYLDFPSGCFTPRHISLSSLFHHLLMTTPSQPIFGSFGPCVDTNCVVWLFPGESGTICLSLPGHWQQTKETTQPKFHLVNNYVYWSYLQECRWKVTGAWVTQM